MISDLAEIAALAAVFDCLFVGLLVIGRTMVVRIVF
jgi:hypothetical protein